MRIPCFGRKNNFTNPLGRKKNTKSPLDRSSAPKSDVTCSTPTQSAPDVTQSAPDGPPVILGSQELDVDDLRSVDESDASEQTLQDDSIDLQNSPEDAPCMAPSAGTDALQIKGAEVATTPCEPQVEVTPSDAAEPELPAEASAPCTVEIPVAEEVVAVAAPSVEAIVAGLVKSSEFTSLVEGVRRLSSDFETKLKYDATKQRQIDGLHKENEAYRRGVVNLLKKDLLNDLIAEIDDIQKRWQTPIAEEEDQTSDTHRRIKKCVDEIVDNLLFVLERHDVLYFEVKKGEQFDPKKHHVLETIDTADPALGNTVIPLRFGYVLQDHSNPVEGPSESILRKAFVRAYKFNPNLVVEEPEEQSDAAPTEPEAQEFSEPADAAAPAPTPQDAPSDVATEPVESQDIAAQPDEGEASEPTETLTDDAQTSQDDQASTDVPSGQEPCNEDNTQQDDTTSSAPSEALDQAAEQSSAEEATASSDDELILPDANDANAQ